MRIPAKKLLPALLVVAVAGAGYLGWRLLGDHGPGEGFISGNGRIEATEIDVAAKLPGRVQDVLVRKATLSPPASRWRACRSIPCWPSAPRPWPSSSARSTAWPAPPPRPRSAKATSWRPRPWWRSARASWTPRAGAWRAPKPVARRRLVDPGTGRRPRPRAQRPGRRACRARPGDGRGRRHRGRARRPGGRAIGGRGGAGHGRAHRRRPGRQRAARARRRVQYRVAQPGEVLGAGGKVLNMVDRPTST